ncbi:MAG: 2-phospho-L-lactate guanylyltransferase [Nitrososphaerales archaeon]
MTLITVPVKGLKDAKRRLEVVLRPKEKSLLCISMLKDVLKAISDSKYVEKVAIISYDETILELARQMGAIAFDEGESRGLNSAVDKVAKFCLDEGIRSLLVLPMDIPLVKSSDIDDMIKQRCLPKSVVIAPSVDEKGTNALLLTPPNVIKPRFGANSFKTHINEAIANRIQYIVYRSPRVALDIDTPKDLITLSKFGEKTETYDYVMKIDLINRVNEYLKEIHKPLLKK